MKFQLTSFGKHSLGGLRLMDLSSFLTFLRYGAPGLSLALIFLSYMLLSKEQSTKEPRTSMIHAIYVFMAVSLLFGLLGIGGSFLLRPNTPSSNPASSLASGFDAVYFTQQWKIDSATDTDFGKFNARYEYTGEFTGSVEGGELKLVGTVSTIDGKTHKTRGDGEFIVRGPINDNQVAGYYTYTSPSVNGFGTA